jgi:hypothetical protein
VVDSHPPADYTQVGLKLMLDGNARLGRPASQGVQRVVLALVSHSMPIFLTENSPTDSAPSPRMCFWFCCLCCVDLALSKLQLAGATAAEQSAMAFALRQLVEHLQWRSDVSEDVSHASMLT